MRLMTRLVPVLFVLWSTHASAMDLFGGHHVGMPGHEVAATRHGGQQDDGPRGGGGGYGAPEPVTTVALALGAGAAGVAAWRRRKGR